MPLEKGVWLPESEDVLLREEARLTPGSIQHRAGMSLRGVYRIVFE